MKRMTTQSGIARWCRDWVDARKAHSNIAEKNKAMQIECGWAIVGRDNSEKEKGTSFDKRNNSDDFGPRLLYLH